MKSPWPILKFKRSRLQRRRKTPKRMTLKGKTRTSIRRKKRKSWTSKKRILSASSRMSSSASAFTARKVRLATRKMRMTSISTALVRGLTFAYHCSTQDSKLQTCTELALYTQMTFRSWRKWKEKKTTMRRAIKTTKRKDGSKIVSSTS